MHITFGTYAAMGDEAGLDLASYDQQGLRIGIFGASGAGKGWLLGLTLEQFHALDIPIICIDPESELWTLQEMGALVLGGPHGDAPIPATASGVRQAMEFAISSGTPVVFDLGGVGDEDPSLVLAEGERLMRVFNRISGSLRQRVVIAVTEAELFAPQQVPRSGLQPQMLAAIQKRGRKRGVIPVIETQRTADIAKSVISQCNKRFIGHLDEPLDFDNVKRHVSGWKFEDFRRLPTGQFVMTPEVQEIVVGARTVTHGGGTPLSGEVTLQRRDTSAELAAMLDRLRAQPTVETDEDEVSGAASVGARPTGTRERAQQAEPGAVLLTRADATAYRQQQARLRTVTGERDAAREAHLAADRERERLLGELGRYQDEHDLLMTIRRDLIALMGEGLGATIQMPDGATYEPHGLSEEDVLGLIRAHAPAGGADAVMVAPTAALRSRYLEAAAQRLYAEVAALSEDEREALQFLLAHTTYQSIADVSRGITGSDSGGMKERWAKALKNLVTGGLAVQGGEGRMGRKENVDAWVAKALEAHDPTEEEVAAVRGRALSLLLASVPSSPSA